MNVQMCTKIHSESQKRFNYSFRLCLRRFVLSELNMLNTEDKTSGNVKKSAR